MKRLALPILLYCLIWIADIPDYAFSIANTRLSWVAQAETPAPTADPATSLADENHEAVAFEWVGDDRLIVSYADGWVRLLSLTDDSLHDIAQYPTHNKIVLAVSADQEFLAVGTSFFLDIYHLSELTDFSLYTSIRILYYQIDALNWNRENSTLAVTGLDSLMAWRYGFVSTDTSVVETHFERGLSPVWHPERPEYAVVTFAPPRSNLSIVNPETGEISSTLCPECRNVQWSNDGRWLGAVGVFGEQGGAFYLVDTENITDEAQPILIGESISNWCGSNQIITGRSGAIRLWDFEEGEVTLSSTIERDDVRSVSVRCSPTGEQIAAINVDGILLILENPSKVDN
jgi:WD40 repeat protein